MEELNNNNFTVYMHISPSGKRYIGMTSMLPEKRWRNGEGYKNQVFFRAIQKYGWNNFEHVIVKDNLNQEEASQLEIDLIKRYKTNKSDYGYNVSLGGDKVMLGHKHTEKTKSQISQKLKERFLVKTNHPCYGKHYNIGVSPMLGKKHSEESKEKMRKSHPNMCGENNPFFNKKHSDESKLKNSLAHIGKCNMSDEEKEKAKEILKRSRCIPVFCITNNTLYASASNAGRELGLYQQNISKVCNGKLKTTGGYCFEYYDKNKSYKNLIMSEEYNEVFSSN